MKLLDRMASRALACALVAGMAIAGFTPAAQAQAKKNYKDQGEYDVYKAAGEAVAAKNWTKAIQELDTWKQKYPESDFKTDREVLFIQAYTGANQPGKVVDTAAPLVNGDLRATFSDPATGPGQEITVLYSTVAAITRVQNPSADQLAVGKKAASMLRDFDRKPGPISDADWTKARNEQLIPPAKAALVYIAMLPGTQAMNKNPKDCAGAQDAFAKALQEYPDNAAIAYNLGMADGCLKKITEAIYEYQRAAVLDPTLGGRSDAKTITSFADNSYIRLHGSDEGLKALKDQVKASPTPPDGFKIKTATEIANEKEAEFEKSNPQLALWMKIKAALADTNGDDYFQSQLKGAGVPKLKGTLIEGKPACHSKELLVAVPLPDAQNPQPEITLKLDSPLTGKPEANTEIQWEGIPSGFTKDPFMLTMDAEKAKIDGLKATPCTAAPARTGVKKK